MLDYFLSIYLCYRDTESAKGEANLSRIGLKRYGYPAQRVFQDKYRRRRFQVETWADGLHFCQELREKQ